MRYDHFPMRVSWWCLASLLFILSGCKERGRTPPPAAQSAPPATVTAKKDAAVTHSTQVQAKPVSVVKPFDRKTLESAYLEIHCIQKKGEAMKLLAAYKKYGFGDPKAWVKAWESQKETDDYEPWLAGLTQRAWKSCP